MRFAENIEDAVSMRNARAAAMVCLAAAWMVCATAGEAQSTASAQSAASPTTAPSTQTGATARTGVSRPSTAAIMEDGDATASQPASDDTDRPAKPSAGVPATPQAPATATVYGPYVPYRADDPAPQAAFDPDANMVTEATAGQDDRRLMEGPGNKADPDGRMVTYVPSAPGEIPDGTLLKVRLQEELSTLTTRPGTKFTAEVSDPVLRDGRVIVPVGAVMTGRVTWVREGKKLGGAAAIHLEPWTVTLPDGSEYVLRARVIDTSSWDNTKVDSEGTILRRESGKRTAGVMGLTAGGGMAVGAMIAGVPGALIGAGVGASVTAVVWLRQDRQAVLPKELGVVFSLTEPMSVTPANAALAAVKARAGGE